MFHDWSREQVAAALERGDIILVDVREPHEFAAGRIPGSRLMPLSRFDPADLPFDEGKQVVLSCAAGVRSRQALNMAAAAGAPVDTHYAGGFKDWVMSGGEIERD